MIKPSRFYILLILLGLAALYVHTRSEAAVPANKPLELFPQRVDSWRMTGQDRFDERVLAVLRPADYLSRAYVDSEGHRLSLYIGFHDGGPQSGPIHSPKQCLPGSGWNRLRDEVRSVSVAGQEIPYVSAIYQKDVQKQLFLYWFQVRDDILTNEYALKLAMARNSFLANRRDSSFIRLALSVTDDDERAAIKIGEGFIRDFFPAIKSSLPE
jgi:EpsI family protein